MLGLIGRNFDGDRLRLVLGKALGHLIGDTEKKGADKGGFQRHDTLEIFEDDVLVWRLLWRLGHADSWGL